MSALVQRARTASAELRTATVALNEAILKFQDLLVALDIGVVTHVEFPEPVDDYRVITFERHGEKKWQICVSRARGDVQPLLNAPRSVRIAAAPLLTALLGALIAEAERMRGDVANAAIVVGEAIEHMLALAEEGRAEHG